VVMREKKKKTHFCLLRYRDFFKIYFISGWADFLLKYFYTDAILKVGLSKRFKNLFEPNVSDTIQIFHIKRFS